MKRQTNNVMKDLVAGRGSRQINWKIKNGDH